MGSNIESMIDFVMDIEESNENAVRVLNDLINYNKILVWSLSMDIGNHEVVQLITDTVRPFNVQAYKRKIIFLY